MGRAPIVSITDIAGSGKPILKAIEAILFATLLVSASAVARDQRERILMGTVETVGVNGFTVRTRHDYVVNVHTDNGTKYVNVDAEAKPGDLTAGSNVLVRGEEMSDGKFHAIHVRFRKPGKNAPGKADGGANERASPKQ